jgi:xylose isomerase
VTELVFSADFAMFGQDPSGFGPPGITTLQAIDRAGEVGELQAFDLVYPFSGPDTNTETIKQRLASNGLRASVIHPSLYTDEFAEGALTNPDPELRARALDVVCRTVEAGRALDVDYVKIWPGRDGFDYPFQVNYADLWRRGLDMLAEVGSSFPGTRFAIEYKHKDPRTHLLFGNAARLLLGLQEIGIDNLGIVVDFGHALFAGEAPADSIHLAASLDRLFGVEFNDNFRASDDDLTAGSVHLLETIEFVRALREVGYSGVWELDQTGMREDPVRAARASIRTLRSIDRLLDSVDMDALRQAQSRHDALDAQRVIHEALLGLGSLI